MTAAINIQAAPSPQMWSGDSVTKFRLADETQTPLVDESGNQILGE